MKTKMILAALLLMAFGTARAQDPQVTVSQNADTIIIVTPDKAELDKLIREYNGNLQRLYDSIDWKRVDEELRRANEEFHRAYDSIDWESIEKQMKRAGKEMEEWGRKMEKWGERFEERYGKKEYHYDYQNNTTAPKKDESKNDRPEKKDLLLNPHWNGLEAGLNLLFNPVVSNVIPSGTVDLTIKPLCSWYFGFNIADVGIAFDKKHIVGLFTGVGIGWNNFSWNNPVKTTIDPETGIVTNEPLPPEVQFKRSKLGLLYLQVPLMVEIRPVRRMYIDLGVTSGLRFAAWSKVKYMDGSTYTTNMDLVGNANALNRFKLDASLRVGSRNLGFFMNYALIPIYRFNIVENAHPLSFGLSVNF
jgi:hypothetical protein